MLLEVAWSTTTRRVEITIGYALATVADLERISRRGKARGEGDTADALAAAAERRRLLGQYARDRNARRGMEAQREGLADKHVDGDGIWTTNGSPLRPRIDVRGGAALRTAGRRSRHRRTGRERGGLGPWRIAVGVAVDALCGAWHFRGPRLAEPPAVADCRRWTRWPPLRSPRLTGPTVRFSLDVGKIRSLGRLGYPGAQRYSRLQLLDRLRPALDRGPPFLCLGPVG